MKCPDPSCSGHGSCTDGNCKCSAGWQGAICSGPPAECPKCPPGGTCDREEGVCLCGGSPCTPKQMAQGGAQGGQGGAAGGAGGAGGSAFNVGRSGAGGAGDPFGEFGADKWTRNAAAKFGSGNKRGGAGGGGGGGSNGAAGQDEVSGGGKGANSMLASMHPTCNVPFGKFDTEISACECTDDWYGENCENQHCFGFNATLGVPDCNAHGMCLKGVCLCAAGWGKNSTNLGVNVCSDPVCPVDCGDHGLCQDNACVCQEGWQGPACREPKCNNACSGHGTCTFVLANSPGECVCEYGYTGPDCMHVALYEKLLSCPNDCSGNGLCMNGKCVCGPGSFGLDCNRAACPPGQSGDLCQFKSCPRDCSGFGACFNGECACDKDHGGADCSMPMKCMEACQGKCFDSMSSQCEFCKGECLSLSSNPVIGHHSPMAARLMTLVQKKPGNLRKKHYRHAEVSAVQKDYRSLKWGSRTPKKTHRKAHKEVSAVRIL